MIDLCNLDLLNDNSKAGLFEGSFFSGGGPI